MIERSISEFIALAEGTVVASPTHLGAFGLSLIHRFGSLDSEHFIRFTERSYDANRAKNFLIRDALSTAPVNEQEAKVRQRLYEDGEKGMMRWLERKYS
ncbi:MAG TPA: hypothetical protein VFG83_07510 [Kofleriaceae bacterium]|nr:hypothetical protein [Kofleriaceae bacterium]